MNEYEDVCNAVLDKKIFGLYGSMKNSYLTICANTISLAYGKPLMDVYSDLTKLLKEKQK